MARRRDRPEARAACRRVRSGVGGYTCAVHGRSWPCRVPDDPSEQLALLEAASPLGAGVLAEVAAERVRQLDRYAPSYDNEHTADDWAQIVARYLNEALQVGNTLRRQEPTRPVVEAYRLRLVQVAAVAAAAVEALDRVVEEADKR